MKRLMLIAVAATMLAASARKDAYIVSVGSQNMIAGASVKDIEASAKRFDGRYVWLRRGGREYVITDETLVVRAEALFAPQAALGVQQSALGREESQIDSEESRLDDAPRSAARDQRLAEIHARQRRIEERERELDRKEEQLEREAESAFWRMVDAAIRAGQARSAQR
jgi:hypothetical protein